MGGVGEAVVEAAAQALHDLSPEKGCKEWPCDYANGYRLRARAALAAAYPAIRADIAAEVLAPIEALIETDGVFLKKDTKIKRVQEDRRRDLGAIVTTSMVTVDDIRAALSTAKEASE